jgi:hypothetical protein
MIPNGHINKYLQALPPLARHAITSNLRQPKFHHPPHDLHKCIHRALLLLRAAHCDFRHFALEDRAVALEDRAVALEDRADFTFIEEYLITKILCSQKLTQLLH